MSGRKLRSDEQIDWASDPLGGRKRLVCDECSNEFFYPGIRRPMKCPFCEASAKHINLHVPPAPDMEERFRSELAKLYARYGKTATV